MEARANRETEKERERARIAADLAEFLRRGGVIERVTNGAPTDAPHANANHHSPVSAGGFADD